MPEGFRHRTTTRVRFAEVDGQKLLYHGRYVQYMDMGLQDYWRACGAYQTINLDVDPVYNVRRVEVDYLKPIVLDELIDIWVRIAKLGNSSVHFDLELHGHNQTDLRAAGREVHVHLDRETGRPAPLTDHIRALVKAFEPNPRD